MATQRPRLRILRVADVPRTDAAGVSGVILRSGQALVGLGHEVEYLFGDDLLRLHLPAALRRVLIPVVTAVRVVQRVRRSPFDVVEIHRPIAWPYALLARTAPGRRLPPCVLQCQGLEELWWDAMRACWERANVSTSWRSRAAYRVLIGQGRLASRYASGTVVPTEVDARHLVKDLGVAADRVVVAHNGVEPAFLAMERDPAPPDLRLLYLGSWLDRKGAPDMAAAWALVHERHPSVSLTVAGSGHAAERVIDDFPGSCRGSVTVLPHVLREEVPDLLKRHDVLVLPSWYEGMPLAVLEGAGAGLAIVTTRIAGTCEVFSGPDPELDGAILVDVQSPDALAAAICRLAEDRRLVESLGERARARASLFTWEASARSFAYAYEQAAR